MAAVAHHGRVLSDLEGQMIPRFNIKAQVKKLGADSLLPPKKLTTAEARKFNKLVDGVGSRDQLERITSRLALTRFVKEHGKEACDAAFDAENKRRAKRK
jgi:hypothetical protein